LVNNLGKKLIESAQRYVDIPKNHDYGRVFTYGKARISKNLISLANHYANKI
jgi:hypothetical protein